MTNQQVLLKNLLKYNFYEQIKSHVSDNLFEDKTVRGLVNLIKYQHEQNQKDLTLEELEALYFSVNPTLTAANRKLVSDLVNDLQDVDSYDDTVATTLINNIWKEHQAKYLADMFLQLAENRPIDLEEVQTKLDVLRSGSLVKREFIAESNNPESLVEEIANKFKWKYNFKALNDRLGGIGAGTLTIICARPNCGKSLSYVSFAANEGGWLEQGARIVVFCNEEDGSRTRTRMINAFTGLTEKEILQDIDRTKALWKPAFKNGGTLKVIDCDKNAIESLTDIEEYLKLYEVDIVIIDQLDKMENTSEVDHKKLKALYIKARKLAKRYNVALFGISQAGDSAHGKLHFDYTALDESRTGKAGEGDVILGIGMQSVESRGGEDDNGFRAINILKNKLTGTEGYEYCTIIKDLSRIKP